jgi:hypothetical protein
MKGGQSEAEPIILKLARELHDPISKFGSSRPSGCLATRFSLSGLGLRTMRARNEVCSPTDAPRVCAAFLRAGLFAQVQCMRRRRPAAP